MSTDVLAAETNTRGVNLSLPVKPGTGGAVQFSNMGQVTVRVTARSVVKKNSEPSMTVTIEDSDDGDTWFELTTFTFTASGTQSQGFESPRRFLRPSWRIDDGAWAIPSVLASPVSYGPSRNSVVLSFTDGDHVDFFPPDGEHGCWQFECLYDGEHIVGCGVAYFGTGSEGDRWCDYDASFGGGYTVAGYPAGGAQPEFISAAAVNSPGSDAAYRITGLGDSGKTIEVTWRRLR